MIDSGIPCINWWFHVRWTLLKSIWWLLLFFSFWFWYAWHTWSQNFLAMTLESVEIAGLCLFGAIFFFLIIICFYVMLLFVYGFSSCIRVNGLADVEMSGISYVIYTFANNFTGNVVYLLFFSLNGMAKTCLEIWVSLSSSRWRTLLDNVYI